MADNTSITLGDHFDRFVQRQISGGRYRNASEVIRAGLRLLEADEQRLQALRKAMDEGFGSGFVADFDPEKHLEELKARRHDRP